MTFEELRAIALELPEVEQSTSYGTPAFKIRKKLLVRVREDGETLALKVDVLEREALLADPGGAYFITPHYQDYAYVVVRLAKADPQELRELLIEAWLREAPKGLVAEHQADLLGE